MHVLDAVNAGKYVENTSQALAALVEEDRGPHGPIPDLVYVEVDIQVPVAGCMGPGVWGVACECTCVCVCGAS